MDSVLETGIIVLSKLLLISDHFAGEPFRNISPTTLPVENDALCFLQILTPGELFWEIIVFFRWRGTEAISDTLGSFPHRCTAAINCFATPR